LNFNDIVKEKFDLLHGCTPEVLNEMAKMADFIDHLTNKCKGLEAEIARLERLSNG
jgi:hypothetical protein